MRYIGNQLLILMPVFNDWDSVSLLLDELDGVLTQEALPAEVLLVDDGSVAAVPEALRSKQLKWIKKVDILHLRRNLGHQRAIAIGLAFIDATRRSGTVVVMDGDGEDQPVDSMGLFASLANRCLLRRATPTAKQIAVWDRILVRISRCLDPLLCHVLGRSVLDVWQKASGLA